MPVFVSYIFEKNEPVRIHLSMQGTQVQSLVWKDAICCGATKPVCHIWKETHDPQGGSCVLQLGPDSQMDK